MRARLCSAKPPLSLNPSSREHVMRPLNAQRTAPCQVGSVAVVLMVSSRIRASEGRGKGQDRKRSHSCPVAATPDALEISRRAATADVMAILEAAGLAEEQLAKDDPSADVIALIRTASASHLEQLGGEYDSGLTPEDDASPLVTSSSSFDAEADKSEAGASAGVSVDELVDRLTQAYARTRGALENATDPGLARLMASIATFQLTSAQELASSADAEMPQVGLPGLPQLPTNPPMGISSGDLKPVVLAEDAAGYAYEVLAAHRSDAPRVAAVARAAVHRARGDNAATAAQIARGGQDPRRVAYDLPGDPSDDAYVRQLELNLTESYATLIGLAAEEERVHFFDLMVDSYHAAQTWGAESTMYPGLPEQQN